MTIRILILIMVSIVALPFMVFLRPAFASPENYCALKAEVFMHIAAERDKGTTRDDFLKGFGASLKSGKLSQERYWVIVGWTYYVYKSTLSKEQLYEETMSSCLAKRSLKA